MRSRAVFDLDLRLVILLGVMMGRICSFVPNFQRVKAIEAINRATTSLVPPPARSYASSTLLPASVTGAVYSTTDAGAPKVSLFTKEGCTLCDKVKLVLTSVQEDQPHSLEAVDITDTDQINWYDKYKYDIPVLHMNGQYWTKHRMTTEEAVKGLMTARGGTFTSPPGEPNAAAMERKQTDK
jgi:thiol-disulfide isomerase/thioredoxin